MLLNVGYATNVRALEYVFLSREREEIEGLLKPSIKPGLKTSIKVPKV